MAIYTKEEFKKEYGLVSLDAVNLLVRRGKIKLDKKGMIDIDSKHNVVYCQKREEKIKQQVKGKKGKQTKPAKQTENQKSVDELALKIDLMNAQLEEKCQKSKLLQLKIAKEQRDVIEIDVLNRCIQAIFADMIKNLTELPNIYAGDIIKFVQTEDQPKELLVEFLTQKITNILKQGLNSAKTATKKYYKSDYDIDGE